MCLLTVFSNEAELNDERMLEAAHNNPDGFGWAILLDGHIARFRSMDFTEAWTEFRSVWEAHTDCWGIFHHRFSTGGGETVQNCHPFTWAHDERIAIAHNGVLPIKPGRRKSDTRIWTEENLKSVEPSRIDDDEWWAKTEKWLGTSKAAFLSAHPDTEYGIYIMNEHLGHWDDGVWWSNRSYEAWRPSRYSASGIYSLSGITSTMSTPRATDDYMSCNNCLHIWRAESDYSNTDCEECGFCWLCEESAENCMCWQPTEHAQASEFARLDDHYRAIAELSLGSEGP